MPTNRALHSHPNGSRVAILIRGCTTHFRANDVGFDPT